MIGSQNITESRRGNARNTSAGRFLVFSVADDHFAIPVLKVSEIIRLQGITRIAKLPPYVKGVINLRGKIIPVIDLRMKFNLSEAAYGDRTCVVVAFIRGDDGRDTLTGLIVENVDEVIQIRDDDIVDARSFGHRFLAVEHISGVVQLGERIATILEIDSIINQHDLQKIEATSPGDSS